MIRRYAALLAVTALALAACGEAGDAVTTVPPGVTAPPSTTSPGDDLPAPPGSRWVVVSFGLDGAEDPVLPNAVPTIDVGEDGLQIGGTTGCNNYFGTVTRGPGDLVVVSEIGMTEMACLDEGVMDQEQRFLDALSRIDLWVEADPGPRLEASDGSATILLAAEPAVPVLPLAGDWRLTTFIDGETASSLLTGTEVTLSVDTDEGTISGNGGCNSYSGAATLSVMSETGGGAAVVMGPIAATEMACEPGIMDQETRYLAILGDATTMVVDGGLLTIATDDGRALVFEPAAG